jgi:hypothetical protein
MADLFFPQLGTGAIAHYPIRKTAATRTVLNALPGGNVLMYPDEAARKAIWTWDYVGLTMQEAAILQNFFLACTGPLNPFTFLDPTGNLLSASSDFTAAAWQATSGVGVAGTCPGPISGVPAITLVNTSQAVEEIAQTLNIPGNFSYCFSLYLSSPTPTSVRLFRRSVNSEDSLSLQIGPGWKRVWTAGNLQDQSTGLSVGLRLPPGQQVTVSAAQLEPQPGMSVYVNRPQSGDVYPNAHWAIDELGIRYLGPGNCAVSVAVES